MIKTLRIVMHTLSLLIVYPVVFILATTLYIVINCLKWIDDKNNELLEYYNHSELKPTYLARDKKTKEAAIRDTMERAARVAKIDKENRNNQKRKAKNDHGTK